MHDIEQRLIDVFKEGRLAHCYLFTGERGTGKRQLARKLAATVLETSPERLVIHPDFFALTKDTADGEKTMIGIADVRALRERLALTAALGGWKVAIVEDVEMLEREAASALLKTLEEPHGQTLIIMTAERASGVLATIRSRAMRVSFPPVAHAKQEVMSPEIESELKDFFVQLHSLPLAARFKMSERYASNTTKQEALLRYAADVLERQLRSATEGGISAGSTIAGLRSLLRADALLTHTNANPRLLFDVFLINL